LGGETWNSSGKKRVWVAGWEWLKARREFWVFGNDVQVFIQEEGKYFVAEDFLLLETVEYDKRVKPVEELIEKIEWESVEPDDLTRCLLI
jgi:hypothetical protein